jgi:hypothetical protein
MGAIPSSPLEGPQPASSEPTGAKEPVPVKIAAEMATASKAKRVQFAPHAEIFKLETPPSVAAEAEGLLMLASAGSVPDPTQRALYNSLRAGLEQALKQHNIGECIKILPEIYYLKEDAPNDATIKDIEGTLKELTSVYTPRFIEEVRAAYNSSLSEEGMGLGYIRQYTKQLHQTLIGQDATVSAAILMNIEMRRKLHKIDVNHPQIAVSRNLMAQLQKTDPGLHQKVMEAFKAASSRSEMKAAKNQAVAEFSNILAQEMQKPKQERDVQLVASALLLYRMKRLDPLSIVDEALSKQAKKLPELRELKEQIKKAFNEM